ncbi:MAG: V-type ATPase subunit [Spirochaetaceae bacterium]|jgi:vacuolar-type H+-ATPase subunit C/Vma6|nr:V-type ATPase subunit [Spirochaetaceae bacterium]
MKSGEQAFIYAKACGIIGRSFIDNNLAVLRGINHLSDLDKLVFPDTHHELPAKQLLRDFEDRVTQQAIKQITAMVNLFHKIPDLLIQLIRSYECADLKIVLSAHIHGEKVMPGFTDIGLFRTIKFEAYPDLLAMLKGTNFEFLLHDDLLSGVKDNAIDIQMFIDHHYYKILLASVKKLNKKDRQHIEILLREEIILHNIIWALRLRTYYRLSPEAVRSKLIAIPEDNALARDALASLSFSLQNRSDWKGWKYECFLNPDYSDRQWEADPRYVQNKIALYVHRRIRKFFHGNPFSLDTAFCFIKLKQYEEDILTSIAEGLGLGLSSTDVFSLIEVPV